MSNQLDYGFRYDESLSRESNQILSDFIEESIDLVISVPRHKLGNLAVAPELVVAMNASISYILSNNADIWSKAVIDGFRKFTNAPFNNLRNELSSEDYQNVSDRVGGETQLWRNYAGLEFYPTDRDRYWLNAMKTILDMPDTLPYFEAGINDIDFIKSCSASGIDVEMALAVKSVASDVLAA